MNKERVEKAPQKPLDKGSRFEQLLAQIVSVPLLAEFVHVNPHFSRNQGATSRELCDVLIEDGEFAVPLQLKTSLVRGWADPLRGRKWVTKKLREARNQAVGAYRSLCGCEINSNHPIRGNVCYAAGMLKCEHMIVVVTCNGLECAVPNEVSSRGPNATTIHYFDFNDFLSLCDIVKTLPDLYIYLNERGKLAAWGRPLLTRECDLYAYYLTHAGRLDSTIVASDLIGEWDRLTSQNYREYVEMIEADKETKVFTLLIEEVRRCVTDFSDYKPGLAGELALSQQQINFLVARKLNALRLIERREFCKRMRDKMTLADASSIGFNFFAAFNDSRDSAILFLASREPRDKRRKCLETLMVYLSVTQHLSEVVGVATENLSVDGGRSCDFAIYNPATAENHDPDDVKLCQRLFKDIEVVRLNVFPGQSRRIINP